MDDSQRTRLYAMVREAQIRAIPPFDVLRAPPMGWGAPVPRGGLPAPTDRTKA